MNCYFIELFNFYNIDSIVLDNSNYPDRQIPRKREFGSILLRSCFEMKTLRNAKNKYLSENFSLILNSSLLIFFSNVKL